MADDSPTTKRPPMAAGQRCGRLVAVEFVDRKHGHPYWRFQCDCGTNFVTSANSVKKGATISCGCYQREVAASQGHANVTHGKSKSPEYFSWKSMLGRCSNPKLANYKDYGGRGIKVCDRWLNSFEGFLADMGPRPSLNHTLDRYPNNDGNYEPGNCRWATDKEQNRNQRSNHLILYEGREMSLAEASELAGMNIKVVRPRLKHGWSLEKALATPARKRAKSRLTSV